MNELRAIVAATHRARVENKPALLATVVRVRGSAYRRPGARMLLTEEGWQAGSISGGCLEGDILRKAWWRTRGARPVVVTYDSSVSADSTDAADLAEELSNGFGLGCNGIVDVLLERIAPDDPFCPVDFIAGRLRDRQAGAMATILAVEPNACGVEVGQRLFLDTADAAARTNISDTSLAETLRDECCSALIVGASRSLDVALSDGTPAAVFVEVVQPPLPLLICGAGHDAIPLARMASNLGWAVTVVEPRPGALPRADRFPGADAVLALAPRGLTDAIAIDTRTSAVVMTHNTTLDAPLSIASGAAFEVRFPYEAPVLAARLVTSTLPDQSLPPLALRVATTRGTNALLTRRGTPPAFFVTAGHGDLLEIGTQQRPDLFALDIVKPTPLTGAVVEVNERLAADGSVLRPLDEAAVADAARRLVAEGIRTAAIALMHSYRNPAHEQRVAAILREVGFTHISVSSELSPFIKLLPRAQTAVVNAYLAPIMDAYLGGIIAEMPDTSTGSTLHVMTSAGGLVRHTDFRPKDSLLSGPAGGVVGALHAGRAAGFERIIAFDMGGTSTDVARCDGSFDYVWEHTVGDAHLVAPALAIESVAAGGGSICYADKHGLHVGPQSAGANPGPACYGAGGPLTITDVNLLLDRLDADAFEIPLDHDAAERAADRLIHNLQATTGDEMPTDRTAVLRGLLDIANERMADAIRSISLRRGYDPADYALVAFGGAGDQHACAVAAKLGMQTVIVPPDASLLSAWGLGQAAIERFAEQQILHPLNIEGERELAGITARLEADAIAAVAAEGVDVGAIGIRRRIVTLRLAGQETGLAIEYLTGISGELADTFAERYETIYGYRPAAERTIEIEAARVAAGTQASGAKTLSWMNALPIRVDAGWTAASHPSGATVLTATREMPLAGNESPGAVREALFMGRFTAIAEEMGEALRRTALSTNVKERLDFSCALLDANGQLVATAAHIPVHLGALGACVQSVREAIAMQPGDAIVTNHPAFGGSHLPDVTIISPVFDASETRIGYVASRAHHAEIGGTRPGSMPPDARCLAEEGVVIPPTYLVCGGVWQIDAVCQMLLDAPYPTRAIGDNRADLLAALAANAQGAQALARLAREYGTAELHVRMAELQARAEHLIRDALHALPDDIYYAVERLDDRREIHASIKVRGDTAIFDFQGTSWPHPGNLNATSAIVTSVILYVLRLLVKEPLPLNAGLLRPIFINLPPTNGYAPPGTFLSPPFDRTNPMRCPAVVGGNTEISQRLADTLIRALGLAACSQGTMNNTLYGSDTFAYYETLCGGAGATSTAPGASAVHTNMTNTRITDSEICELRYPVRIARCAVRRGSGGMGHHRGGDGMIRETVFLAPMALSVLTQHRVEAPYGMTGGKLGATGRQRVVRETGEVVELESVDGCDVLPGDLLVMETPGGGGWGERRDG